jgi:hypothetical protein
LDNQGIAWMNEIITELFTTLVLLNTTHKRKNRDSKIANVTTCKVFKTKLLDVQSGLQDNPLTPRSIQTGMAQCIKHYPN